MNRPNIFLSCEELPFSGGRGLSHFALRVSEILDGNSAIIYTDFIDDIGPIVSELSEYDIDCVAYSVRLRTVPVVLARALLMTSYRAYLWSIRACTMT